LKELKDRCKSKYLISQHKLYIWLCLECLFIKLNFLFNHIMIEINKCLKLIEKNQIEKNNYARFLILEKNSIILCENKVKFIQY